MNSVALGLKKALQSGLQTNPFERSLLLATFDDADAPPEEDKQCILEALLGCHRRTTQLEAIDAIGRRPQESWTWTVVLKCLVVIHFALTSDQTSEDFVRFVVPKFRFLKDARLFREGEGTDGQAEDHAVIVRAFGSFMLVYSRDLMNPLSVLCKTMPLDKLEEVLPSKDSEEIFREFGVAEVLLKHCLHPFVERTKIREPRGFCALTEATARCCLKSSVRLYGTLNALALQMFSRLAELSDSDMAVAAECYRALCEKSDQLNILCDFVASLPTVDRTQVPRFSAPAALETLDVFPPEVCAARGEEVVSSSILEEPPSRHAESVLGRTLGKSAEIELSAVVPRTVNNML